MNSKGWEAIASNTDPPPVAHRPTHYVVHRGADGWYCTPLYLPGIHRPEDELPKAWREADYHGPGDDALEVLSWSLDRFHLPDPTERGYCIPSPPAPSPHLLHLAMAKTHTPTDTPPNLVTRKRLDLPMDLDRRHVECLMRGVPRGTILLSPEHRAATGHKPEATWVKAAGGPEGGWVNRSTGETVPTRTVALDRRRLAFLFPNLTTKADQ